MPDLTRDQICYSIDRNNKPALTIKPGQTIIVETEDALNGRVRKPEDTQPEAMARFHAEREAGTIGGNPATGPVHVEGAEPGDALLVTVEDIQLNGPGVTRFRTVWSPLGYLFEHDRVQLTSIEDGYVRFNDRIRFPINPHIGVLAAAPAIGAPTTGETGQHGGNMDCPDLGVGATAYLPVAVPGAYLYVGDVHAAMADAEICDTGIEIQATVTLRVELQKGRPKGMSWPRVVTEDAIITVVAGKPLDASLQTAFKEMILWMEADYGWDRGEAYLLLSQVAHGRLCNSWTIRCVMPKTYL